MISWICLTLSTINDFATRHRANVESHARDSHLVYRNWVLVASFVLEHGKHATPINGAVFWYYYSSSSPVSVSEKRNMRMRASGKCVAKPRNSNYRTTRTGLALLGTPFAFITNNIQYPGVTTPASSGISAEKNPPLPCTWSGIRL